MHLYPGTAGSYPEDIHLPDDGDPDAAAAYDVAFAQLADRTATLKTGGIGLDFTDCIFHGTTIFADGSISATVDSINLVASSTMVVGSPSLQINASTLDGNFQTIDIDATGGNINISTTAGIYLDGAPFKVNGGVIEQNGFNTILGNHPLQVVEFGSGVVNFHGAQLAATGLATFNGVVAGGVAAGVKFTGNANAQYRSKELVDADFALICYIQPSVADFFYLESMAANRQATLISTSENPGATVEISMVGLTPVGRTLEVYDEASTQLVVMSPNTIPYTKWIRKPAGGYRRIA